MIPGSAFATEIPEPISSGGSMATNEGLRAAAPALVMTLLVQTTEERPFFSQARTEASISARVRRRSEWLIRLPFAPANFSASAVTCPVAAPGTTPSTCWA